MKSFNLAFFELTIVVVKMWTNIKEFLQSNHREVSQVWPSYKLVSSDNSSQNQSKLLRNATVFKGFGRRWA